MKQKQHKIEQVWDCGTYYFIIYSVRGHAPASVPDTWLCIDKETKKEIFKSFADVRKDLRTATLLKQ